MNQDDELDIRSYISMLRKRAKLLAAIVVVCVLAAGAVSYTQPKIYTASARVVLSQQADTFTSGGVLSDPNAFQAQLGTQVQVVKSPDVVQAATTTLGAPKAAQVKSISAAGVTNTRIMTISATSKSPAVARDAANAYAQAYLANRSAAAVQDVLAIGQSVQAKQQDLQRQIDQVNAQLGSKQQPPNAADLRVQLNALNAQMAQLQQQYTQVQAQATVRQSGADLLSAATLPTSPTSPKPMRNMALALVLGLLLGVGAVLLIERLDDRVRSEHDLNRYLPGVPHLASIPRVADWKDPGEAKAVTLVDPQSQAAESYRRLRTSIDFLGLDKSLQVIEITSATAGEGKSTTVANLATALAWTGKRVVIVAADLRRPRVHEFFHLSNAEGFTSILLSGEDLASALQPTKLTVGNTNGNGNGTTNGNGAGSVHVLATGPLPPNPTELLGAKRVRELFDTLRRHADYVLVDSPPILPVADPLVISQYTDGVLLVAGADKVRRRQLEHAAGLLQQGSRAPLLGVVLNGAAAQPGYSYGYDGYYAAAPAPTSNATVDVRETAAPEGVQTLSQTASV